MALDRDRALALVQEYTASDALRKHMYAVELAMRAMAERAGEDEAPDDPERQRHEAPAAGRGRGGLDGRVHGRPREQAVARQGVGVSPRALDAAAAASRGSGARG